MNRLLLPSLLFFALHHCLAQPISWITDCSEKNFCLNNGSCTQGAVYMVEKAVTNCGSPNINYSYKIDLNNDGTLDLQSSEDTIRGNFAKGTHKVTWRASDNCGSVIQCTYLFHIKDCSPPNLLCINGLTQTLDPPNCTAGFSASQFVISMSDNCIPTNQLELGIRKTGTGTGFPSTQSIEFGLCDNGFNQVEVWVRDNNGLTNQCSNYVLVQIGDPVCDCNEDGDLQFTTCARSTTNNRLSNFRAVAGIKSLPGATTPFSKVKIIAGTDSCLTVPLNQVPFDQSYVTTIRGDRPDAALNGVTTFDLVLVSKHILGIESLTSAYQMEAADVNNSNSITTFDIVETRKLILGIYDTFPLVPSWRFVRPLSNPSDLGSYTALVDTYQVQLPNLHDDLNFSGFPFVGIKYGDINFSAELNGPADDRSAPEPVFLQWEDRRLNTGEVAEIKLRLSEKSLQGWQFDLQADPDVLQFLSLEGLMEGDYVVGAHSLRALAYPKGSLTDVPIEFTLKVKALRPLQLSQVLALNTDFAPEAYTLDLAIGALRRHPLVLVNASATAQFLGLTPNPFSEQVDFQVFSEGNVAANLEIFTQDGRSIFSEQYDLAGGKEAIRVSAASLPEEKIFFYRMRIGTALFSGKLVKI